jgi:hypothetical protein
VWGGAYLGVSANPITVITVIIQLSSLFFRGNSTTTQANYKASTSNKCEAKDTQRCRANIYIFYCTVDAKQAYIYNNTERNRIT